MEGFSKTEGVIATATEIAAGEYRVNFSGFSALEQIETLTYLLEHLPDSETLLRVKLLARLAAAQVTVDSAAANQTLKELSLTAHAANDDVARSYALVASNLCDLASYNAQQRVADTQNALEIAVRVGEAPLVPLALLLRLDALLQTANIEAIDREISPATTSLRGFHHVLEGRQATWARCMRATLDGRLTEAEELVQLGFERAEAEGDLDGHIVRVGQLAVIRWLQGKGDEIEPFLLQARQVFPDETIWAAAVAWIWNHQGRETAARGMLRSIGPIADFPNDRHRLAGLAILGEVVAKLGPPELAREIYNELLPHRGQFASIGLGVTTWGPVSRSLAVLADKLGDRERAETHFTDAIELCSALGAQVWLSQAQIGLAEMLHEDGAEPSRVLALAEEAVRAAEHLGLQYTELKARRLLELLNQPAGAGESALEGESAAEHGATQPRPRIITLHPFQVFDAEGDLVTWRSHKAAQLLKILVARRGVPIPRGQVLEHLWPDDDPAQLSNRFAVAISTIRSALDPEKRYPRDEFVRLSPHSVGLNLAFLDIDCEDFLNLADRVHAETPLDELEKVVARFTSGFLADEPYVAWAEPLRREIDVTFSRVGHQLAQLYRDNDQQVEASQLYQRLIEVDEFDQKAHEGLIRALRAQGAHGRAATAAKEAQHAFAELGIEFFAP